MFWSKGRACLLSSSPPLPTFLPPWVRLFVLQDPFRPISKVNCLLLNSFTCKKVFLLAQVFSGRFQKQFVTFDCFVRYLECFLTENLFFSLFSHMKCNIFQQKIGSRGSKKGDKHFLSQPYTRALLLLCPMQPRYIGHTAPLTASAVGDRSHDVDIPHYKDARMQHSQSR